MNRRLKQNILKAIIYLFASISAALLIFIAGFIVIKGYDKIDIKFLTSQNNSTTQYVNCDSSQSDGNYLQPVDMSENSIFIESLGLVVSVSDGDENGIEIQYINKNSPLRNAYNVAGKKYEVKTGDVIKKINSENTTENINLESIKSLLNNQTNLKFKLTRPGGGILPMLVTTLILIALSLLFAVPVGVFAAIYLTEYAKEGVFLKIIRFATETLAGIPSIVYGLFGMIFFVKLLKFNQSMLSGSLTLAIILLPTIIRTTEETLKTVPDGYKEGSYALGANKTQTLWKVIMPNTISGILVAIILSIGRIVGESAALLFTAGTFAKIPESIFDSGASLTVRAYMEVKEYANVEIACAMGVVLLAIVLILNILAKIITKKLQKGVN